MKYVKYIFILVVILFLLFIAKGALTPSITYESQITVDKPVGEAWAVITDESKISDWLKEIKKIELISGTPNTVGAVSKIYVAGDGEEMVMEETITAITPNEHMAMRFTMDFMNMDYEMNLKEVNGKTQISTQSTTVGNGIFAKSIVSFMTKTMKMQEDKNLNQLKEVIEQNTTPYFENNKEVPLDTVAK